MTSTSTDQPIETGPDGSPREHWTAMGHRDGTTTWKRHTWTTEDAKTGLVAALDPCAAPDPRPWSTARQHFTVIDDGLRQPCGHCFGCAEGDAEHGDDACVRDSEALEMEVPCRVCGERSCLYQIWFTDGHFEKWNEICDTLDWLRNALAVVSQWDDDTGRSALRFLDAGEDLHRRIAEITNMEVAEQSLSELILRLLVGADLRVRVGENSP